jgi:uncharacterized Fe-S cluster-containing radical SAM superfamily protein
MKSIDTARFSAALRERIIDLDQQRLLITNFLGSEQERDLTEAANCRGFGRIRHFRRQTSPGWPENPLPIAPACRALKLPHAEIMRAQAFQNAACNWRCWYCFVPDALLSANPKHADWLSPQELVECYQSLADPPLIIDLTGGQPDLTPEWVPWTMQVLRERGLSESVYLWSDDNLSNDYFWRYLSETDRLALASYPNYGRVGCFKGYDADSFAFNTRAEPSLFDQQFELMGRLIELGLDIYAYATFTSVSARGLPDAMPRFVDRLQALDENLPLRTVPLEIQVFTPVTNRVVPELDRALKYQWDAIDLWQKELERRFPATLRALDISSVPLATRSVIS